jgi:threonine/homoserine/homoserine lactone efflux protein
MRKKEQSLSERKEMQRNSLTDFDETVLFLTRPYIKITVVCWFLSLFCIIGTVNDMNSSAFVLGVTSFLIDSIFFLVLCYRAKWIRRKNKTET